MKRLPKGAFISNDRKYVPPPRANWASAWKPVIHHFKLWTEGFKCRKAKSTCAIESPRGELGCYLSSDGSNHPHRVHFRTPSFILMSALSRLATGSMLADLVAIIGSIDIVLGDSDR